MRNICETSRSNRRIVGWSSVTAGLSANLTLQVYVRGTRRSATIPTDCRASPYRIARLGHYLKRRPSPGDARTEFFRILVVNAVLSGLSRMLRYACGIQLSPSCRITISAFRPA